ncbi:MAG: tyrosine-type recombinase/integrase [Gemmatimonadetes bacterium]|nr:tyrosine-type recombinase/integrase [Gemmatimonadota bacterium]
MRSIWVKGKEDRKSLGHRDREVATREAYELLSDLAVTERAAAEESLTLGMLQDLYLASPQHRAKKERTQKHDERKLKRVVAFLGPNRNVASLSDSDVQRFTIARRAADKQLENVVAERAVNDRTVEADLKLLVGALNWALRERTGTGQRLLRENPLFGVRLPREQNPRRPVMTHDVYQKLLAVAPQIHPLLELALVVAEGTGRRLSAWRNLRWDDVDLQAGTIRWRAEFDKKGYEQVVPMSEVVSKALREARKAQAAIGASPVFPAPQDPTKPCDRYLLDRWLRRAFEKAEVPPLDGGLWHSLRRKWATERKGYPVKDVAAAGGWRDEGTILKSYQQVDPETVKQVVLHPTRRLSGT